VPLAGFDHVERARAWAPKACRVNPTPRLNTFSGRFSPTASRGRPAGVAHRFCHRLRGGALSCCHRPPYPPNGFEPGRAAIRGTVYGQGTAVHGATQSAEPLSVPWLVAAATLIGAGIFCLAIWIITNGWAFIAGAFLLVVGALMLFNRRAGADRSP
jgi:hypothetical protein